MSTSALGMSLTAVSTICMRSATLKVAFLLGLLDTATMTCSKRRQARWMMSRWPLVRGSKLPG